MFDEKSSFNQTFYFWSKFRFSNKIFTFRRRIPQNFDFCTKKFDFDFSSKTLIFEQNFHISTKTSSFEQNFYLSTKLRFWAKFLFFDQNFDFWAKFLFSIKTSIFEQNFDFWVKYWFFDQKCRFWANFWFFDHLWVNTSPNLVQQYWPILGLTTRDFYPKNQL